MLYRQFREIKTSTWHTIDYLGLPASQVIFSTVEREIQEPQNAADIRKSVWNNKLQERMNVLKRANLGKEYFIDFDPETKENALYEKNEGKYKRKMWAGTTVSLSSYEVLENIAEIRVHPISYTEWIACYDPQFASAYEEEKLPLPYAGIGVSVLLESTDGLIPLTRRGIETPVYPGMLYSPGGGPQPGENSTEAILREVVEEVGLKSEEHFDTSNLFVMALVSDTKFAGTKHSRPEIVARLPTNVSYRQMEEIQQKKIKEKGLKETDVWGLEPVSMNSSTLSQTIKFHGYEMCPPTEAALTYELYELLRGEIGRYASIEELKQFIKTIENYERGEFKPPIKALADI